MNYVDIQAARALPGLRLVLTAGVPGPWGEAAKALLHVKGIEYTPVMQVPGQSDDELRDWTAQTSAPVAMLGDERPRSGWADILCLAERLAPEPGLTPDDPELRVRMFGLANELCGEGGFAWQRRLMLLHPALSRGAEEGLPGLLGRKYGWSPEAGEAAPARAAEILRTLSTQLKAQAERGSRFFVGEQLSALDLYWATFSAMLEPLPADLCPMQEGMRAAYTLVDPEVQKAADPILLEQRDQIYRDHLKLPLDF